MQTQNTVPQSNSQNVDVRVRIHSIKPEGGMRARCSLELGGCFAVRGVKLMDGAKGYFLSMPSYKTGDTYKDLCFPVTKELREKMLNTVVREYEQTLEQTHLSSHSREPRQGPDIEMEEDQGQSAPEPEQTALPSHVPPSYYAAPLQNEGQQFGSM